MFAHIIKRNGTTVPFEAQRITAAITKAGQATGEFDLETARRLTWRVLSVAAAALEGVATPQVEQIQDLVEEVLLSSPYKKTAKAYIIYREQRARLRELVQKSHVDLLDTYLRRDDWQVNENANMAYSLQGLNNYVSSEITRTYWLNRIYPEEIRRAHQDGDFHLHDLNLLSAYCVGWDLADLLQSGFTGAPGKAESLPARHFGSALGQIVNFFYTLQGEAAGAQAFASFDTYLAPFIRHDHLDYPAVKQAMQEFVFNLNVPTRVGFQTPFTNLTMDLRVPTHLRNIPAVIGGEPQPYTYGDCQEEMDLLNRAFLEVMSAGDAKGRVFTFPIPTYNITKDFDFEDPRLRPLWEVTARYGIPYFANFINSELSPDDARSMCCRLRLDVSKLVHRGGGLFGASPLTGSIGVVTINLPRLGYQAENEADFLKKLDNLMDLAKASLEMKRKALEQLTDQNLYPYSSFYLREVKKKSGSWWANHFSTIGLVGLNEAAVNHLGVGLDQAKGAAFGLRVLDHMRERLSAYQKETGLHFNLEATPAESTSYRLAKLDAEAYPDIVSGANLPERKGSSRPYYTNSSQLPVDHTDDIFALLDHQADFQAKYTGGTVQHVFVGEAISDPDTVKEFIRTVCQRYRLPYVSVTPTFSICPRHGYLSGEVARCPQCQQETEIYSRIVGYLRPIKQWNEGKAAEFHRRSVFNLAEVPDPRPQVSASAADSGPHLDDASSGQRPAVPLTGRLELLAV